MTHIAIVEQLGGRTVGWMEKISDEQYQAALSADESKTIMSNVSFITPHTGVFCI